MHEGATDDLQLTPLRRQVLALVQAAPRPIKAYDLLKLLSEARGRAAPPTVYRALNYLVSRNLIHRVESMNAYAACALATSGCDHAFLICEECGQVAEIELGDVRTALMAAARRQGFDVTRVSVEVKGVCRVCPMRDDATSDVRGERAAPSAMNSVQRGGGHGHAQ